MSQLPLGAALVCLGLSLTACGGGADDDEAAIERLMSKWLMAYEDGDAAALTDLFVEECGSLQEQAADEMEMLHQQAGEITFDLTGVDIRNLTDDTAEVMVEGSGWLAGEEVEVGSEGGDYVPVANEDGEWRISSCSFLAGGS